MFYRISAGDALVTDDDPLERREAVEYFFRWPNMAVLFEVSICSNGFKKQ